MPQTTLWLRCPSVTQGICLFTYVVINGHPSERYLWTNWWCAGIHDRASGKRSIFTDSVLQLGQTVNPCLRFWILLSFIHIFRGTYSYHYCHFSITEKFHLIGIYLKLLKMNSLKDMGAFNSRPLALETSRICFCVPARLSDSNPGSCTCLMT